MSWTFPNDRKRRAQTERFWAIRLKYMAPQEQVYVTDDLSGVAVWTLPGRWHVSWRETGELGRMMLGYRLPLLLCYWQGLTQDQTARQLGWSAGSVKGRLERGRKLLADRLVELELVDSISHEGVRQVLKKTR